MAPKVERVTASLQLGGGPHWDPSTQSLYFVDIFGKAIHRYVPETKKHTKAVIGNNNVSFIIPLEGHENKFLISIGRALAIINWDGESENVSSMEMICEVDNNPETLDNRFNDGKCDTTGRLWAGTIGGEPLNGHVKPNRGNLFSLTTKNSLKIHLTNVSLSNGLTWNLDNTKFYYIDTPKGIVEEYDFDIINGSIDNPKTIFTLQEHEIDGALNGMTIDADGNLWIAIFNGYRVIKINPRQKETLLNSIEIPAKQVTSVSFGGPNLDELYVTTGSFTVNDIELPPPEHGATYVIHGTETTGFPGKKFKLE